MRQYDKLDAFIADLPRHAENAAQQLRGHNGVFMLNTREGRRLTIFLEDGRVRLSDTAAEAADCTVTASEEDLLGIINGRLSPAKALLFGKIRVRGNPAKLLELIGLMG